MNVSRHDPHLALSRLDYSGAVGSDKPGLALAQQMLLNFNHILERGTGTGTAVQSG